MYSQENVIFKFEIAVCVNKLKIVYGSSMNGKFNRLAGTVRPSITPVTPVVLDAD